MFKSAFKIAFFLFLCFIASSPNAFALNAQQIYKKVRHSIYTVYGVDASRQRPTALGSAVAISKNVLATNCHVAMAGDYIVLKIHKKPVHARIIYQNQKQDLCLIEVPNVILDHAAIRHSKDVDIGEDVIAIGNPIGIEKTLSRGIISNKHIKNGNVFLQTDAAVSKGSSGGGLFDTQGNLIGIITLKLSHADNIALAISTEWVKKALKEEPKTITKKHPRISSHSPLLKSERLGTYGKDHITLIRRGKQCVFSVVGTDRLNQIKLEALWSPTHRGFIMLFPLNQLTQRMIINSIQGPQKRDNIKYYARTHNRLLISNHAFSLLFYKRHDRRRAALVTRVKYPLSDLFHDKSQFILQIHDTHSLVGHANIRFGLNGFEQALKEYNKLCEP